MPPDGATARRGAAGTARWHSARRSLPDLSQMSNPATFVLSSPRCGTPTRKRARELRGHLFGAMQWAVNQGYRDSNPASPGVTQGLGKQARPVHHKSLAHPLLGSALAQVRDSDAWWAEKACLIFSRFHRSSQRRGPSRHLGRNRLRYRHLDNSRPPDEKLRSSTKCRSAPKRFRFCSTPETRVAAARA